MGLSLTQRWAKSCLYFLLDTVLSVRANKQLSQGSGRHVIALIPDFFETIHCWYVVFKRYEWRRQGKGHDRRPVRTSSLAGKRQRSRMCCFDDERFWPKRSTTTILEGEPHASRRTPRLLGRQQQQQPLARRHRSLQVIATRSINTIQCLSAVSWNAMCGARGSRRDVLWSLLFSLETMTAATTDCPS
ncbi:unnamed protein product [Haemonchus placei]|uniref:Secreted protein n=1 Tax=Haemonchus placei TaxID=6290 RepID=A0A0N4WJT8_HAEPC|nr:unnamed protein product [Haemonchus placei]